MKNFLWTKINNSTCFSEEERSRKDMIGNALSGKLNVNEEYLQTFRTKSYIEMFNGFETTTTTTSSDTSNCVFLEPNQEFLNHMFGNSHIHPLLIDYFQASFEAYNNCQFLLQSLHQTRTNHYNFKRIINLIRSVSDHDHDDRENRRCSMVLFKEMSSFSQLENPFSIISPIQFRALHEKHHKLLQQLTNKGNEIRRRLTFRKLWKRLRGACFVITNIVVLVALLILSLHSLVGIVAAPGLVFCFVRLVKKRRDRRKLMKIVSLDLVRRQMDIAAKAAYIMINDFDTLSRMVARLDGEVEHMKVIAKMCIKSRKSEILKEAMKEFVAQDDAIVDQMKELEQHIYLCFLTINRSRRFVVEEITGDFH